MNSQLFVPVQTVAAFPNIRKLSADVAEVLKAMEESTAVTVSADKASVKPNITAQRNTIILREIPASTAEEDVKGIFTSIGHTPKSVRSEVGDIWFVTMESEKAAREATIAIHSSTFQGNPIKARLKSENLLLSLFSAAPGGAPGAGHAPAGAGAPFMPPGGGAYAYGMPYRNYGGYGAPMYGGRGMPGAGNMRFASGGPMGAMGRRGGPQRRNGGRGGSDAVGGGGGRAAGGQGSPGRNGENGRRGQQRGAAAGAGGGRNLMGSNQFPPLDNKGVPGYQHPYVKYQPETMLKILRAVPSALITRPSAMDPARHPLVANDRPNSGLVSRGRTGSMDQALRHGRPVRTMSVDSTDYDSLFFGEDSRGGAKAKSGANASGNNASGAATSGKKKGGNANAGSAGKGKGKGKAGASTKGDAGKKGGKSTKTAAAPPAAPAASATKSGTAAAAPAAAPAPPSVPAKVPAAPASSAAAATDASKATPAAAAAAAPAAKGGYAAALLARAAPAKRAPRQAKPSGGKQAGGQKPASKGKATPAKGAKADKADSRKKQAPRAAAATKAPSKAPAAAPAAPRPRRGWEKAGADAPKPVVSAAERAAAEKAAAEKAAAEASKAAAEKAAAEASKAAAEKAAAEKAAAAAAAARGAAPVRTDAERKAASEAAKAELQASLKQKQTPEAKRAADQYAAATKSSKTPADKKAAAKKESASASKGTTVVGALVGDAVVSALAAALALGLLVPDVKKKALAGDVEGAAADAQAALAKVDGLSGKAGYVGTVVAADALSHLPVLGALVPGPAEFIGAVAATLLAARYVVTKEATPEEDLAAFGSTLPGEFPPADFGAAFAPVAALAKKAGDADLDALQEDLAKAPEAVQKWFGDLENPVETIAPPAAALGAAVLVGQVANFPVLALVFPRLLELAGVATVVQAVNKYGGEEGGSLKEDLAKVAARGGDAVKALAGKK